jgi:hypothetical protein
MKFELEIGIQPHDEQKLRKVLEDFCYEQFIRQPVLRQTDVSGELLADYDWKLLQDFKTDVYKYLLQPPFNLEHAQHGIACEKLGDVFYEFWKRRHGK